jgi:hypothetical protein
VAILSENPIRCFGLDIGALRAIADRINAPTLDDLGRPVESLPQWTASMAFRTEGPWG